MICLIVLMRLPLQGHYVPAVANKVYRAKELGLGPPVNLKGAAIGNGFTAPAIQYGAYADYALMNELITPSQRDSIQRWYPICKWGANFCSSHKWGWLCGLADEFCQVSSYPVPMSIPSCQLLKM